MLHNPAYLLSLFLVASVLMIWRLEELSNGGMEGTVLGNLVMPYLSGLGNLIFVVVILRNGQPGEEVMTNCLVNNATNLTLLVGLPAVIWGLSLTPRGKAKKAKQQAELHRLALLLTLLAIFFFGGITWALGKDGVLDFGDGLALIGLFFLWQLFHVYELLKENVRSSGRFNPWIIVEFTLLALGGYGLLFSITGLVDYISDIDSGFISRENLGLLTGLLMALPNAMLALFYGARREADVVYSAQAGDAHVCIPLCVGLYAIVKPLELPANFTPAILMIAGVAAFHVLSLALFRRLHRASGGVLIVLYGVFLYWSA
ncbi:sodium:calcium symporter [Cerasicoccus fimbriatus]|uniref:sodium:calcium symporter n=1 Tax=Cerasicoccus fimbriatus TaxID=3014554 RepID=UPI0022B5427D|nr:sodium:calcium symporter [Cerasicoccus sp. TK19100]